MTVLCAFNEHDGLTSMSSTATLLISTSTADGVIAGLTRAVFGGNTNWNASRALGQELAEGWAHVRIRPRNAWPGSVSGGHENSGNMVTLNDNSGNVICAIYVDSQASNTNSNLPFNVRANGTGGLSGVIYTSTTNISLLLDFDINFKVADSDGFYKIYLNGSLIYTFTGDTKPGTSTGVASITFQSRVALANLSSYFSQVVVSDLPTIGARVHTLALSAFGDLSQWAGAVTDVNGTEESPATILTEGTPNEQVLFTKGTMSAVVAGNVVSGVVMGHRSRYAAGSPVTKVRGIAKVSGTIYENAAAQTLTESITGHQSIFGLNPATSAPWTVAEINAAQIGMKAEA